MKFKTGDIVKILLPTNYNSGYDYILTEDAEIGDFACVNVRNIKFFGLIIGAGDSNLPREKIRKINYKISDFKLSESDIKWLFQMSNYTMIPLGMVLKLIINVSSVFEKTKQEILYKLNPDTKNKITEQRQAVIDTFAMNPDESLSIGDITSIAKVSRSVVNNMIKTGFLEQSQLREIKNFTVPDYTHPSQVKLSDSQKKAVEETELFNGFNVHLLDGVTGSGKTEVYFELVEKVLNSKKQVLIMMPEIALTAQFINRFEKRFGDKPTLWHSALSENNRREIWKGVNKNEIQIIIGTRSALFLPWKNLGLIVIDEEHDSSYKQDENGIYHARDMAIMRGKIQDFPIVLASATPSAETIYNTELGKYKKSVLESRYGNATMPKISVIDLKQNKPEAIDSKKTWLSPLLVEKINQNLDANHQVMLFLNRRGFAPITICPRCGFSVQCENCSVNMVYHKKKNVLVCHYCGCEKALPKVCEHCGYDEGLITNGVGVEKIKEECEIRFPNAKTMIISSDQISAPKSMERIIKSIENKEVDILIGTQILAKGHHFPNLTLVGVVDADMGLFNNDFRASEKTFSNLFQVAGRAGRGEVPGEVLIQTIQPEHPVIQALQDSNRDKLMTDDLKQRKLSKMPPYSRLIAIIIECEDENKLNNFCKKLERAIPKTNDVIIAGPINATIEKIRTWYRMRFLIMGASNLNLQKLTTTWLGKIETPNGIKIKIDVDLKTLCREKMKLNEAFLLLSKSSDPLSARVLLKFLLKESDIYLLKNPKTEIGFWKTLKIKHWNKLLQKGIPVSKITHQKEFYGNNFYVNKKVLCPRPDTETMIDFIKEKFDKDFSGNIIDLGTGSGCIILTLLKEYKNVKGTGIDISKSALKVAKTNRKNLDLEKRAIFSQLDFKNLDSKKIGTFDLIVSNPPYIAESDNRVNSGAKFDPKIALFSGCDGLDSYRVIAQKGRKIIKKDGLIFLEIGIGQTEKIKQIFKKENWIFIDLKKDLNKINRILCFQKK